ncbi:MAG TPA: hypothetical protein VMJ10_09000 [Kofleriaceae bacterium]|nr:hypothetical protein [Kofleriaceae bacterium]
MTRTLLAALAFVAGCACSADPRDLHAYVAPAYSKQIAACETDHQCAPLCMQAFHLSEEQQLQSCRITSVDSVGGARIEASILDYTACASDSAGATVAVDDGDDGCSDGSCDDGSDDGSSDDGGDSGDSGDDGGDSGDDGGDGGGSARVPHAPHAPAHVIRAGA